MELFGAVYCVLLFLISQTQGSKVELVEKASNFERRDVDTCVDNPVCATLPDICHSPDQALAKSLCPAKCGLCPTPDVGACRPDSCQNQGECVDILGLATCVCNNGYCQAATANGVSPTMTSIATTTSLVSNSSATTTSQATSSLYDSSCVETADCTFDNSQCVSGFCKCVKELKYDQSSGTCVSQCAHYGDQFTFYDNVTITYHTGAVLIANGIDECVTLCLTQSFTTLSINWNEHAFNHNGCICSTSAPGMTGVVVFNSTDYGLAVRQCGLGTSPDSTTVQTTNGPTAPTTTPHVPSICDASPCSNGGTCSFDGVSFHCTCAPGFSGTLCSQGKATCTPNYCQHNGVCLLVLGKPVCGCPSEYTGAHCEIVPTAPVISVLTTTPLPITTPLPVTTPTSGPCDASPCINGGSCLATGYMFTCSCPNGYSGPFCNVEPPPTPMPTELLTTATATTTTSHTTASGTMRPNLDCYIKGQEYRYIGNKRLTKTGKNCLRWDANNHAFGHLTQEFIDGDKGYHSNYCRETMELHADPVYFEPWCYTGRGNGNWEVCGVPMCP